MALPSIDREIEFYKSKEAQWEKTHPGEAVVIKYGEGEKPCVSFHPTLLDAFNFGMNMYKFEPFYAQSIPRAEMDPASYALRSELIRTQ